MKKRRVPLFLIALVAALPAAARMSITIDVPPGIIYIPEQPASSPAPYYITWEATNTDAPTDVMWYEAPAGIILDGHEIGGNYCEVTAASTAHRSGRCRVDGIFGIASCQHTIVLKGNFWAQDYNTILVHEYSNTISVWVDDIRTETVLDGHPQACGRVPEVCNATFFGEPVNVATGSMYHEMEDLAIQGPLPIRITRRHDSTSPTDGPLGVSVQRTAPSLRSADLPWFLREERTHGTTHVERARS